MTKVSFTRTEAAISSKVNGKIFVLLGCVSCRVFGLLFALTFRNHNHKITAFEISCKLVLVGDTGVKILFLSDFLIGDYFW